MADNSVKNISANLTEITLQVGSLVGIVDRFDPEADIISVADSEIGGSEITPDGRVNIWGKNALIPVTLNLSASSQFLSYLQTAANLQQTTANKFGVVNNVNMIVKHALGTDTYSQGVIKALPLGTSVGNDKLKSVAVQIDFANIIKSI